VCRAVNEQKHGASGHTKGLADAHMTSVYIGARRTLKAPPTKVDDLDRLGARASNFKLSARQLGVAQRAGL